MSRPRRVPLLVLSLAALAALPHASALDVRVRIGARTGEPVAASVQRGQLMLPLDALGRLGLPVRTDDIHDVVDVGCLRVRAGSVRVAFMPAPGGAPRMLRAPDLPVAADRRAGGVRVPVRGLLAPFGFRLAFDAREGLLTLTPPDVAQLQPDRATCALALAAWLTGER
ncbi:hypothetical protein [Deinococcus maricopensis]|nr:hypothetical protein [Deinococcus maricopensis]